MAGRVIRILFGFVIACLAAGLMLSLFFMSPGSFIGVGSEVVLERLGNAAVLALAAATVIAPFSAPLAIVAIAVAEWRRLRQPGYYLLVGLAIAAIGFIVQQSGEISGQPTIVNAYAGGAFVATGIAAGFAYWLFAGRRAGGGVRPVEIVTPVARSSSPSSGPGEVKAAYEKLKSAAARPAPSRSEVAKPEAGKPEPGKAAPAKVEAPKPSEPAKAEAVKPSEPAKPDSKPTTDGGESKPAASGPTTVPKVPRS